MADKVLTGFRYFRDERAGRGASCDREVLPVEFTNALRAACVAGFSSDQVMAIIGLSMSTFDLMDRFGSDDFGRRCRGIVQAVAGELCLKEAQSQQ